MDMQRQIVEILKKKERKRKIVIAACLFMCIVSFGYLGAYYQVSAKSAKEFEELSAMKEAGAQKSASGRNKVKINLVDDELVIPDIPRNMN